MLLTRTQFREGVFSRDNHKCVFCASQAVDAHHIIERRLFEDGGYYLDNGASVCETHHLECERTLISVEQVREACGIKKKILPNHLYDDEIYDKWGNIILPNGQRLKGELFYDESVQKIIVDVLHLFTNYVKYPRTYHLPWSLGMNEDDRMHSSTEQWKGKRVVITKKMDGENTTMYRDHIHARSINSGSHPSRTWIKNFWAKIRYDIPEGWRICGENLYAQHSIGYDNLRSYFYGFSIWDDKNFCLNIDDTVEYFYMLGISIPDTLYNDEYNEKKIKDLHNKLNFDKDEGYVLRIADGFPYSAFKRYVGKFVRPNHVQTTKHWMRGQEIVPNKVLK